MSRHSESRKVLLVYITKVSGHRQATVALQRTLKHLDPLLEIKSINGFGYTYPRLEKIVNKAYMGVIKRTPQIWDYLYDNPKLVKNSSAIKEFLHKTSHKKLAKLFESFHADTVVCTQAFPCGMMADYKLAHKLNFKLIGVLTDYAPHAFWLNEGIDYYVVPSEEAKVRFMHNGIPEDKIKVYGIPIRPQFAEHPAKRDIAHKLGLNPAVPTILIMGGGQGLGPIKGVVKSLVALKMDLQLVVICGINKKLMKWLAKTSAKSHKKILAYEYTDSIDELMELATVIVTKPGGMTTSECLAKGLPMVVINPIPGQEMRNTEFLLKKGIALMVKKVETIGETIQKLLTDSERLASMRRAALESARPLAAVDIAKLILEK